MKVKAEEATLKVEEATAAVHGMKALLALRDWCGALQWRVWSVATKGFSLITKYQLHRVLNVSGCTDAYSFLMCPDERMAEAWAQCQLPGSFHDVKGSLASLGESRLLSLGSVYSCSSTLPRKKMARITRGELDNYVGLAGYQWDGSVVDDLWDLNTAVDSHGLGLGL
jgi:hypothetical protein